MIASFAMVGPNTTFAPRRFESSAATSVNFAFSAFKEIPITPTFVIRNLNFFLACGLAELCGCVRAWGLASAGRKIPRAITSRVKHTPRKSGAALRALLGLLATTKAF